MPVRHIYQNVGDRENWVHETTHGLNSLLRNKTPARDNAFYCLEGRACFLLEPKVRITQVVPFVQIRGATTFQLYLIDSTRGGGWDDCPLYIMDEWVAYTNGSAYIQETKGRWGIELQNAFEFCGYVTALVQAIEKYDPNYPDKQKFLAFVAWNMERVMMIYDNSTSLPAGTTMAYQRFRERHWRASESTNGR